MVDWATGCFKIVCKTALFSCRALREGWVLGRGENKSVSVIFVIMQVWENIWEEMFPWKAWLFKCLHIVNMTSNSLKMRPDFYATCLCSPIYIFMFTVIVTLPRLGQIYYHFVDSRTLKFTPIVICYMINLSWSIPHRFFQNAIAGPILNFIFKEPMWVRRYACASLVLTPFKCSIMHRALVLHCL